MNKKIRKIIETLGQHEDNQAIAVLEELGTNSADNDIRELTSQMLVRKNHYGESVHNAIIVPASLIRCVIIQYYFVFL